MPQEKQTDEVIFHELNRRLELLESETPIQGDDGSVIDWSDDDDDIIDVLIEQDIKVNLLKNKS